MQTEKRETIAYLQWLRIFAAAAVVMIHTAGSKWLNIDHTTPQWAVLNFYDSLARWPVPVFMMITGALLLPRRTPMKRILTGYIPRIGAAFLVWSGIYTLDAWHGGAAVETLAKTFVSGHFHLWYLPFLIGIYLTIPFLQRIAEDEELTRNLLRVSFVIGIAVPWLASLGTLVMPQHSGIIRAMESNLNFTFFMDCLFLVVLGYWLSRREFTQAERRGLYILGILGLAVTSVATVWATNLAGSANSVFFDFKAPNNLLAAAALFVFARYHLSGLPKAVQWMASCSFGVYLVHPLVIGVLDRSWGIHVLMADPLWLVPVLAAAVFGLSLIITAALRKIPVIGNWIV